MALRYDGTNDVSTAVVDLSAQNKITLSFWLWWDAFANDDDFACEFTADTNTTNGGFSVDPNASDGAFSVYTRITATTDGKYGKIVRPSAASWHHYAIGIDRTAATGGITVAVDGVPQTVTMGLDKPGDSTVFGASTLYFASRAGTTLFGACAMAHYAIYSGLLTTEEAASLGAGYSPLLVRPTALLNYWPMDDAADWSRGAALTTSGAVAESNPRIILPFQRPAARTAASGAVNTPVNPDAGTIVLAGYAPAVAQSANQQLSPDAGSVAITGHAPTIAQPQSVTADVGAVSITGYAPTVSQAINQAVNPDAGTLAFTGHAPSVNQSANQAAEPGAGSIALTGYAPLIAQTAHQAIAPDVGTVTVTGYVPTGTQESASRTALPDAGLIQLTGYAPAVFQSGAQDFGGVPFFQSEQAAKYRKKKEREQPAAPQAVAQAVETAIATVVAKVDVIASQARAERALKTELKRAEVAYQALYARQLEEARNAVLIEELQALIQRDLDEQDEEEAMLLLM